MEVRDADDLVPFRDVRVLRSTAPALLCRIGARQVWLPRNHICGKLWCIGDRGTLFIRRWLALDRHLLAPDPDVVTVAVVPTRPITPVSALLRGLDGGKRDAH